ncbi:MAG: energy transducer TonB [Nitrosomonas sp.]|jgi:protein TonB|nr:energy transducer TonB [Nitrosomonas sp.]MCP5252059.1 energy transducer TonB [Burkholderiales bacterium]MDR4519056.1 energy transducer TonB [Nitrosomonas sp.]MDR4652616.1 energy transducer TonB [Nitrosomonas sp.]HQU61843.1 energy transducer TonB [Nitrosomonas sp.]
MQTTLTQSTTRQSKFTGKHGVAILSMLTGPVFVFGLILVMNHYIGKIDKTPIQEVTEIAMVKQIQEQPKQEIKKVEPPRRITPSQAPAPFTGLDTALSGIDLGMLGFNTGQMGDLDDSLIGKTGNAVMTADLVDVPPRAVSQGAFRYPPSAKKNGIRGYVVLSILVSEKGSVDQVQVLESNPSGVFDAAALQGIRSWQFEPAKYKGDVVRVWAKQRIRFDLS